MTYTESAALMTDPVFGGRVRVACIKFADSILNEPSNIPAHNTRLRWAQSVFNNPQLVAIQIQPPTVMDSAVQADGAAVTDVALQGAVETVVQKTL